MGKTNDWAGGIGRLVFRNESYTLLGDSGGILKSVADGSIYVSLHTAALTNTSDQGTNEATYTGYARKGVGRNTTNWNWLTRAASNAIDIVFAQCTAGSDTITHFGIGTDATGTAGKLLYWGAFASSISVSSGITPTFSVGDLRIEED